MNKPVPPLVASDGMGGGIFTWQEKGYKGDLYAQRVDADGNRLWGKSGRRVCRESTGIARTQIVSDYAGGAIIAWSKKFGNGESAAWKVYAQRLDSRGNAVWGDQGVPVSIGHVQDDQILQGATSDGSGGAILLCHSECRTSGMASYVQRIDRDGDSRWGKQGKQIGPAITRPTAPQLATDGSGGAVIVWEAVWRQDIDILIQRVDSSGTPLWEEDGVLVASATGYQSYPQVIHDGLGNHIVAWITAPDSGMDNDEDYLYKPSLYAQKIGADGEPLWPETGVLTGTTHEGEPHHHLTSDGSGGCIIAWPRFYPRQRPDYDVRVQRISSVGETLWGRDGVLVWGPSAIEETPYDLHTVSSAGGAIVVWQVNPGAWLDVRFEGGRVCVQQLSLTGDLLWDTDGVQAYGDSALESQAYSNIASDGMGGVLIGSVAGNGTWPDTAYAQRVDADGNKLWGDSGIKLAQ